MRALIFAIVMFATPAWAMNAGHLATHCEPDTGNEMLDEAKRGICFGYITGAVDAMESLMPLYGDRAYCAPTPIISEQYRSIFMRFIRQTPEVIHVNASFVIASALRATFPCD